MRRRRTQPIMYMPRDAKVNEAQPKTAEQIFAEKDAKIAALEAELATLKEKTRWRKQSEEPAPAGQELEIYSPIQERVFSDMATRGMSSSWFWRPLDLPEKEGKEE